MNSIFSLYLSLCRGRNWMGNSFRKLPEQITRLLIVFIVLVGGIVIVRQYIVPVQLKETGFQRTSAIEKEVSKEIKYMGSRVCTECHDDVDSVKRAGYHRDLSCESCHGAAWMHTEGPSEIQPSAPRERKYCSLCHTYDPSRPTGFPQINPVAHNPLKPCMTCHDPHDPKPSEVPRDCTACHAEIARTKAVSHHALLECTTCHIAPEDHRITPRSTRPSKPTERAFCGECHALDSTIEESPKVDLDTHETKYVCWQCHYPHMPEGGQG
jgi:hypothetical protein